MLHLICIADSYRILYTVVPVYIAEIAPEKLRGRLLILFSTVATVGNMVCIAIFHPYSTKNRYIFNAPADGDRSEPGY